MSKETKSELISSFIDNEIKSKEEQEKIKNDLENDSKLKFDLISHKLIKKTVNEKYSYKSLTQEEQRTLLNNIEKEQNKNSFNFVNFLFTPKRKLAFGFFIIILLVTSFIFYNSPLLKSNKEFALSQIGNSNMYVRAINNFNNLVNGKLPIQYQSNNPKKIEEFFKKSGVDYPTHVAIYKNCELFGAIISKYHGVKLAHHVYKDKNGNMLYVFQVDEQYFKKNNTIAISKDLYRYVENGNSYKTYKGNLLTVMMKVRNNICAVITNLPREELPAKYRL